MNLGRVSTCARPSKVEASKMLYHIRKYIESGQPWIFLSPSRKRFPEPGEHIDMVMWGDPEECLGMVMKVGGRDDPDEVEIRCPK